MDIRKVDLNLLPVFARDVFEAGPWALGLLVVGPWLGHASWHAYRGTVAWTEPDAPQG